MENGEVRVMRTLKQSSPIEQYIKKCYIIHVFIGITAIVMLLQSCAEPAQTVITPEITPENSEQDTTVKLPEPRYDSNISLEHSILQRRSIRNYTSEPLTLQEISQLLWAAQGITDGNDFRTAPSAGALYPLELYLVIGNVEHLTIGIYKYKPQEHILTKLNTSDVREKLAEVVGASSLRGVAITIVIAAVYERTTTRYGDRGIRYVHMEAGHCAQNICLQATALNLGTVTIGGFSDTQIKETIGMSKNETPLYIMPVGRKP